MKKPLIYILAVLMLITCSACTSKEERAANKVKYLTDWRVQIEDEEDCYILFFALKNKKREYVVSPATVEVEIINEVGECVYEDVSIITANDYSYWTSPAKGEEYLAPVYIYFEDIEPGEAEKGKLNFSVWYDDSFYFDDISEDIRSLPVKQEMHIEQDEELPEIGSDVQSGLASLVGKWHYAGTYINGPEITISQRGGNYYLDFFCMFSSGTMCIFEQCPLTYDSEKNGYIAPYEDIAQGSIGQVFISYVDGIHYLTITVDDRPQYSRTVSAINQPIEKVNQAEILATGNLGGISQKEINVFLSNFCEQYFGDFYSNAYSDTQLIEFAWVWTQINKCENISYADGYQYLSAANVESAIRRYFGVNVVHQSTGWLTYSNGQYFAPASNPASELEFAIVDSVNDNSDGTYTVIFTRYFCNGSPEDIFYSYDSYTAENDPALQFSGTGNAVVKPNGQSGFALIEYKTYF